MKWINNTLFIFAFIICSLSIIYCEEDYYYYVQSETQASTYIQPYFPPSGEYYFVIVDNWSAHNALFATIAIILGILISFFGYRFIFETFYLLSFGTAFIIVYIYLQFILGAYLPWWINSIIAIIAGLLFTWLSSCFILANVFGVGFISGFIIVLVFWTGCIGQFNQALPNWFVISQWSLVVIVGGAFGLVSLTYQRFCLIVGTSLIGSFLASSGSDYFFQDHFAYLLVQIFTNQPALFDPVWLAIVTIIYWILLFVVSVLVQWFITADTFDHRKPAVKADDLEKGHYTHLINLE